MLVTLGFIGVSVVAVALMVALVFTIQRADKLQKDLDEVAKARDSWRDKVDVVATERDSAQGRLAEAQARARELAAENDTLHGEMGRHEGKAAEAMRTAHAHCADAMRLTGENAKLREANLGLAGQVEMEKQRAFDHHKLGDAARLGLREAGESIRRLGESNVALTRALETMRGERDRAWADTHALTSQRDAARSECEALTGERDGLREENARLTEELAAQAEALEGRALSARRAIGRDGTDVVSAEAIAALRTDAAITY